MPLVIIVVAIIAILIISKDYTKDQQRQKENLKESLRKTNAHLERRLVDRFMKEGYSFDDAYSMAISEIVSRGFEPCIPKGEYRINSSRLKQIEKLPKFDSYATRKRVEVYKSKSGIPYLATDEQYEEMYGWIYSEFPTTERELHRDIDAGALQRTISKKGEFIIHQVHGTCEILEVKYSADCTGALYTVKVIKTGEIAYIQALDPSIKKL